MRDSKKGQWMNKEVVRNLCRFMALRHDTDIKRIRVGSSQKTRQGSATMYKSFMTGEVTKLNVSISTYNTNTGTEYWDTHNKISILDTIVHEFAHLEDYKDGWNSNHGEAWKQIYHDFLFTDWKDIVANYNLLAVDNLSSSWELLVQHNNDQYFDTERLFKLLDENDSIDYCAVIHNAISDDKKSWIRKLDELSKLGFGMEIGNRSIEVNKNGQLIMELEKIGNVLTIPS